MPEASNEAPPDATIRIGCAGLPPGMARRNYFRRLPYLESAATASAPPKTKVLRRWRRECPEGCGFGLVAPAAAAAAGFRGSEIDPLVTAFAEHVAALAPEVVLIRTPASFAPTARNRDALAAFVGALDAGGATIAWEAEGVWELDELASAAEAMGITVACDPLAADPTAPVPRSSYLELPGGRAYFRVRGLGRARARLDDEDLEELLELAEAYERAWVVFGHVGKYPDALRLLRAVEGES